MLNHFIITASMLRDSHHCPRRLWLDQQQPAILRTDPALFDSQATLGVRHEQRINEGTLPAIDAVTVESWDEGVRLTQQLMRQGIPAIAGAHLEITSPLDLTNRVFTLRGKLDQLLRVPAPGNNYAAIEIKRRADPQPEDWLQLDLYTWLLGEMQGRIIPGELWLGADAAGRPARRLQHTYDEDRLMMALGDVIRLLDSPDEPAVHLLPHCRTCHWQSACHHQAQQHQSIDLLYGVSRKTRANMVMLGLRTLDHVAGLTPEQLQQVKGIGPLTAPAIRANAQAWISQTPVQFGTLPAECHQAGWMFDLETLDDGIPWSLGWCDTDGHTTIALVAPVRGVEKRTLADGQRVILAPDSDHAWRVFAAAMESDSAPIFHWTGYDSTILRQTAPPDVTAQLLPRMHDLHRAFTRAVSLPTRSTSIKVVSAYLGFAWYSAQDWFAALMDYQQWLADDSESALIRSCEYQREDVQSMALVWRWLQQNVTTHLQPSRDNERPLPD